jgi:hypothetical protein
MYYLWPVGVLVCLAAVSNRWPRSFIGIQLSLNLIGLGLLWAEENWSYIQVLLIRTGFEAWFYVNAALANTYHAWVFSGLIWASKVKTHASMLGLLSPPAASVVGAEAMFFTFETLSTAVVLCKAVESPVLASFVAAAWTWWRVVEFGYHLVAQDKVSVLLWTVWVMQAILLLHLVLWIRSLSQPPIRGGREPSGSPTGPRGPGWTQDQAHRLLCRACANGRLDKVLDIIDALGSRGLAAHDNEAIMSACAAGPKGDDIVRLLWKDKSVQETLTYAQVKVLVKRVPDLLSHGPSLDSPTESGESVSDESE